MNKRMTLSSEANIMQAFLCHEIGKKQIKGRATAKKIAANFTNTLLDLCY